MTRAEAAGSSNLVMGRCMIVGESLCVLYDSGVTFSFVSETCLKRLGLPVCERRVWSERRPCVLGVQWQ